MKHSLILASIVAAVSLSACEKSVTEKTVEVRPPADVVVVPPAPTPAPEVVVVPAAPAEPAPAPADPASTAAK